MFSLALTNFEVFCFECTLVRSSVTFLFLLLIQRLKRRALQCQGSDLFSIRCKRTSLLHGWTFPTTRSVLSCLEVLTHAQAKKIKGTALSPMKVDERRVSGLPYIEWHPSVTLPPILLLEPSLSATGRDLVF